MFDRVNKKNSLDEQLGSLFGGIYRYLNYRKLSGDRIYHNDFSNLNDRQVNLIEEAFKLGFDKKYFVTDSEADNVVLRAYRKLIVQIMSLPKEKCTDENYQALKTQLENNWQYI